MERVTEKKRENRTEGGWDQRGREVNMERGTCRGGEKDRGTERETEGQRKREGE